MRKFFLTTLFFTISLVVFSQRIIVFDSNNDTIVKKAGRAVEDRNAVSWNMSAIARGAMLFEYERKLNDYLHVMGGAGITVIDLTNEIYRMIKFENSTIFDNGSSVSAGFIGEVSLKVFPKQSDDMDGFYLGPLYRFRNYNSKFTFNGTKHKETSNFHDIALIIGWQGTTYSDFFYNAYLGFGYGFGLHRNYEKFRSYDDFDGIYGKITGVLPVFTKQNILLPLVGVTMGWVF